MDKKPIIDWNIILETISDDLTSENPTNRRCSNGWFSERGFSRSEQKPPCFTYLQKYTDMNKKCLLLLLSVGVGNPEHLVVVLLLWVSVASVCVRLVLHLRVAVLLGRVDVIVTCLGHGDVILHAVGSIGPLLLSSCLAIAHEEGQHSPVRLSHGEVLLARPKYDDFGTKSLVASNPVFSPYYLTITLIPGSVPFPVARVTFDAGACFPHTGITSCVHP